MIHYLAIRSIAIILGLSAMVAAMFLFVIDLVRSINNVDPTNDYVILVVLILFVCSGAVTIAAPTFIFKKRFRRFFTPFCLLSGITYLAGYLISRGAVNSYLELLLLVMSVLYFLLAYLVQLFHVES